MRGDGVVLFQKLTFESGKWRHRRVFPAKHVTQRHGVGHKLSWFSGRLKRRARLTLVKSPNGRTSNTSRLFFSVRRKDGDTPRAAPRDRTAFAQLASSNSAVPVAALVQYMKPCCITSPPVTAHAWHCKANFDLGVQRQLGSPRLSANLRCTRLATRDTSALFLVGAPE